MIKIGNWLERCDEKALAERDPSEYNSFVSMFLEADGRIPRFQNWKEVAEAYKLDHVTELTFDSIRHIVVLEIHDGSINQVLTLQDSSEYFKVFGGCDQGIINTDGSAFIQLLRDGEEVAVFHIDNSPFDVVVDKYGDGWEEFTGGRDEFSHDIALHEFKHHLLDHDVDAEVTKENTLFVAQL